MPANPNHSKAARNQAKAPPVSVDEATEGVNDLSVGAKGKGKPVAELSRREREAVQAQQAKERYQKLHEAGKTDEAKADLARLKLIREKREAEAARKQVSLRSSVDIYTMLIRRRPRKRNERKWRSQRSQRLMHVRRSEERLLSEGLRKVRAKGGSNVGQLMLRRLRHEFLRLGKLHLF
jgi:hypothetical protein